MFGFPHGRRRGAALPNTGGGGSPATINAPTYALHTASGVSPASWDVTGDATFQPGMWVHQQFVPNNTGDFSGAGGAVVDYYTQINGSDWEATSESIGGGASVGIAGAAQTFAQPTGAYSTRPRFETAPGDPTNNVTSPWGPTVSDTIVGTSTVWNSVNGVNKNQNLTISGSPALTITGPAGFNGSPAGVIATNAAVGKRHWELTMTSFASSNPCYIGIEDGSAVGPNIFPNPPASFTGYRTDGVLYKNGSVTAGTTPAAGGNVLVVETDSVGATMSLWLAGTLLGTITGITASSYYPYAALEDANVFNANFGQNAWNRAPTASYTGMP